MNANFSDVGSEITGSLPRDGQAGMTGPFKAASGTVAAPGIAFGSDTDTGFYRKSSGTIGIVADGSEVGTLSSAGFTDANSTVVTGIPTGCVMMFGATTAPTGWLRCNGRTIGNASSGGTERAHADTSSLFTFLWTNYADSVCAVSSGRGASAAADYAANKTIALPDWRGRGPFGLDDMGSTAAGRLGTIITSPTTNGASGGTETHTITASEMPVHGHTATVTDPGHTHNVSNVPNGDTTAAGSGGTFAQRGTGTAVSTSATTGISVSIANAGSGAAHSNMPPAFLTTFIIKL